MTKQTDYAIRALLHLARANGVCVSTRRLATEEGIPLPFLRRIARVLVAAGWVHAREGVHGGLRLVVPPRKIRLTQVIELMQGRLQLSECLFRKRLCQNRAHCVLRHRIMRIEQLVTRAFARVTLDTLLRDMKKTGRLPQ
ncbi:MAG: Rrf2 family transcriptional regulator [bacterium]|nr:Rrf2 family transcriptional regulator [bacterium]